MKNPTNADRIAKLRRDLRSSTATLAAWTKIRDHVMTMNGAGGTPIEIDVFCQEMERLNGLVREFEHDVELITAELADRAVLS